MGLNQTIWVVTLAVVLFAGWTDWHTRRIPNWLTVSGFVIGITLNSIFGGWRGAKTSLEGAGLALGLLLPLVLLRGLGAGDWKLMGAVGALMGWRAMLFVLFVSVLISGVLALVESAMSNQLKATFRNLGVLAKGFVTFGLRPNPQVSLDNPRLIKLPFGAAVALAAVFSFAMAHWRH